jgi:4-hydroxybutyrate CoA-transferase
MNWIENYKSKLSTAEEAVKCIKSNDTVAIHPGCAVPVMLVDAMVRRKDELENVTVCHILTIGEAPYTNPGMEKHFRHKAFFIGANARQSVNEGRSDYIPVFLSEVPLLFSRGLVPIDVSLIQVSPPDEHGFCSYGIGVDIAKPATECAKIVVALINKQMPRTLGDSFIHINKIKYCVECDIPLNEYKPQKEASTTKEEEVFQKIGHNIADIIEDDSTLQMGIGAIPDAVLSYLTNKRNLGIHTEMFSDGLIKLVEDGVITNEKKTLHKGKMVVSFILGTKKLFDFVHNNPIIEFHPSHYVNDPFIIAQNNKMIAINSALQVDLTGQVCADSIGTRLFSGFGGQLDFMRGAARSEGGKPIIALPSSAKNETLSRITPMLIPGSGVTTTRGDIHYVVTEYGVAYLYGKTVRERAIALINIAHPIFRDELTKFAKENKYI